MNEQVVRKPGKKEGRSPGYPSISLEAALARAQILKDKEPRHFAHISTIFSYWGYGPKSSTGLLTLAALKKFGLVEDRGTGEAREAKITEMAWRILEDNRPHSTERAALIQEAALRPAIHRKLWNDYKGQLPSDETLKYRLRTTERFTLGAVDDFIREFKDTIDFAKLRESDNLPGQDEEQETTKEQPMSPAVQAAQTDHPASIHIGAESGAPMPAAVVGETQTGNIAFPLSPTKWVHLQLPYGLTKKEWARILKKLEVFKAGFMDPKELDEEDE